MMSYYFFKILAILLAITGIVEKAQATTVAKNNTKVENQSKNTSKVLQCDTSQGWEKLDANHTAKDCKDGHCFGTWLTGKY